MAFRKKLSNSGARRLFSATAQKVKAKNLLPPPMRGGIRL